VWARAGRLQQRSSTTSAGARPRCELLQVPAVLCTVLQCDVCCRLVPATAAAVVRSAAPTQLSWRPVQVVWRCRGDVAHNGTLSTRLLHLHKWKPPASTREHTHTHSTMHPTCRAVTSFPMIMLFLCPAGAVGVCVDRSCGRRAQGPGGSGHAAVRGGQTAREFGRTWSKLVKHGQTQS
jgi:hypothetical protein